MQALDLVQMEEEPEQVEEQQVEVAQEQT